MFGIVFTVVKLVKKLDVYDDVIGAYGGKVNQILVLVEIRFRRRKAKKANRFKVVVVYLDHFNCQRGNKTHKK
jgi:hypothetical protein